MTDNKSAPADLVLPERKDLTWKMVESAVAAFRMDISPLEAMHAALTAALAAAPKAESFCYCDDEISLQMVSGGGAPEGLFGRLTLKINGEYVSYLREAPKAEQPPVQEPVAVMYSDGGVMSKADCGIAFDTCCRAHTPLYAAPQPSDDARDAPVKALGDLLALMLETEESVLWTAEYNRAAEAYRAARSKGDE